MDQVREFFYKLFQAENWPPRWYCGKWSDFHGWLYIISDLAIWSAYFFIPLSILYFISKKKVPYMKVFGLFAAFIFSCGTTHLLDAIMFWWPGYRINSLIRFGTAIVSWRTVFAIISIAPKALSLKTAEELEAEIEKRKESERALELVNKKLSYAHELAQMGFWEWDVIAHQLYFSPELYKIFELEESKEVSREEVMNYIHVEDIERILKDFHEATKNRKNLEYNFRLVFQNGSVKYVQGKGDITYNRTGEPVKMFGVCQEVTAAKLTEQNLTKKSVELERSNHDLEKFVWVASHDLKEPLRKISFFSNLLEAHFESKSDMEAQSYLESLKYNSIRINKLVEDLLNFSKIGLLHEHFEVNDLSKILGQALSELEESIDEKMAKILVPRPLPAIEGIDYQFKEIFKNIISNSLKYSKKEEAPVIEITFEYISGKKIQEELPLKAEKYIRICIKDNGIGFDEKYNEKIFTIFQRLHPQHEFAGTGIGLAICKKIVDLHNGLIYARSKPGLGATFVITLPVIQPRLEE